MVSLVELMFENIIDRMFRELNIKLGQDNEEFRLPPFERFLGPDCLKYLYQENPRYKKEENPRYKKAENIVLRTYPRGIISYWLFYSCENCINIGDSERKNKFYIHDPNGVTMWISQLP